MLRLIGVLSLLASLGVAQAVTPTAFVTTAVTVDGARTERILAVDLDSGTARQVFEGRRAPRIRHRLGKDALIVDGDQVPDRLDLEAGRVAPLLPGVPGRLAFAGTHDDAVLVLRRAWGEAQGALLRCVPGERSEAILHPEGVTDVLEVRQEGVYYLVDGSPPEVWTVMHKPGTGRRIAVFPEDRSTAWDSQLSAVLSPSGRRIALGTPGAKGEAGFRLRVVDTHTEKLLSKAKGIRLDLSPISSSSPRLEMVWLNDHVLRFSETEGDIFGTGVFRFVDWDVRTGERVDEHVYGPVGLRHPKPRRDSTEDDRFAPWTRGAFTFSDRFLALAAEPEKRLANAGQDKSGTIGTIAVGPLGRWAITQKRGEARVLLWDAAGASKEIARGYVLRVEFR